MARRSDHTPAALKALAIGKSLEIIDEKGPEGFSARGVATAMGYTVGTLYHVFGSLDGLILHINAAILDEWHDALAAGMARTRRDPLYYLAHQYLDFAKRKNHRWRMLFEVHLKNETEWPEGYSEKMARLFMLVEEALARHTGNDVDKNRRTAKLLWASIHGICVLSLSGKLDMVGEVKPGVLIDTLLAEQVKTGLS